MDATYHDAIGDVRRLCCLLLIAALPALSQTACGPSADSPVEAQTAQARLPAQPDYQTFESAYNSGRVHIVQRNDTLYSLAQRYYGSGQQYTRIYYANRNRLKNPKNLVVGMKLIIP